MLPTTPSVKPGFLASLENFESITQGDNALSDGPGVLAGRSGKSRKPDRSGRTTFFPGWKPPGRVQAASESEQAFALGARSNGCSTNRRSTRAEANKRSAPEQVFDPPGGTALQTAAPPLLLTAALPIADCPPLPGCRCLLRDLLSVCSPPA